MSIYSARLQIAHEGGLIDAINTAAQGSIWTAAELLAIGSRETGFLWGSHWGKFHDWGILGDVGHGHGVFQIDDRSHADFTSTDDWKDPLKCAQKAIEILTAGAAAVDKLLGAAAVPALTLKELYYAAYNCGPRNAWLGYRLHQNPSIHTTPGPSGHPDYGKDVQSQVGIYAHLLNADA